MTETPLFTGIPHDARAKSGTKLRDEALEAVEKAVALNWRVRAVRWINDAASRKDTPFNADDLCADVGEPPRPGACGAIFMAALKRGLIVRVGEAKMAKPKAHARRTSVYLGKGRA